MEEFLPAIVAALALAYAANRTWFAFKGREIVVREPDLRAWELFARMHGLQLTPTPRQPFVTGDYQGVSIRVEAEWQRTSNNRHSRDTYSVVTRLRMGIGAPMPAGLQLRKQGLLDGLVGELVTGPEILVGDPELDRAYVIHGEDLEGIGALLRDPGVRAALLSLVRVGGPLTIDESTIRLEVAQYLDTSLRLEPYLERMLIVVDAFRAATGVAPREVIAPAQEEARPDRRRLPPMRPSLAGLLTKATSAGSTATQAGRDVLKEIEGAPVRVDLEVERVEPYVDRLGIPGGIAVIGRLTAWTSRVEVHFLPGVASYAKGLQPGDHIQAEGYVERYDPLRDWAEVTSETAPEVRQTGAPVVPRRPETARPAEADDSGPELVAAGAVAAQRTPEPVARSSGTRLKPKSAPAPAASRFVEMADRALAGGAIGPVLEALHSGREGRSRVLLGAEGRTWKVRGLLDKVEPTPAWRVGDALRHGRTAHALEAGTGRPVQIRLPPSRNAELDAMGQGSLFEATVALVEWDEPAEQAIFEQR